MMRNVSLSLAPAVEQAQKLAAMQSAFSAACEFVATVAAQERVTNRVRLHHLAYYAVRERFPALGSQLTCNAIAVTAQSLKAHRANGRPWVAVRRRRAASVHLDARTFRLVGRMASIFTMAGRELVPIRLGEFQRRYLERGEAGEAELVCRRGRWFLHIAVDIDDADSRHESRYARHTNHVISADIVSEALQIECGTIVMEDLKNIRNRFHATGSVRARLHRWGWRQLQRFIDYKALAVGIAITYVDPAYTSQTCSQCGNLGNRMRHRFACEKCGIFAHSDRNAAQNLARIGASALAPTGDVVRPNVGASAHHKSLRNAGGHYRTTSSSAASEQPRSAAPDSRPISTKPSSNCTPRSSV
jgi:IS605 OrfB family transposase